MLQQLLPRPVVGRCAEDGCAIQLAGEPICVKVQGQGRCMGEDGRDCTFRHAMYCPQACADASLRYVWRNRDVARKRR